MKRTALITGGNRGIGLAIARKLASLGVSVLLGSRDFKAGEAAVASLRRSGTEVWPLHLDLTDAASVGAAISDIEKSGHSVDVLINNAGVLHERPVLELSDEEIAESIAVHVTGPIRLIRSLVPSMIACKYGRIVNVSSGWG